ncbi:YcgL domain-containing protein [Pasteurella canis]|uniref:YcgL domain-containing protein NCTC11621_01056 n=1 Tax=Pasteurella canis TaxID=753 RepID=A0A379EUF1_9PAST|nr:YcgL domain-containing protein [Pasteurella canis]MXN89526.1 YcgL domain-containing protein [Pasteurella canis]UDW84269.1 YcgL domain-containing protein [Pasteurella canis]UEA17277.1 YcgL domain-containing protein [Pasteurella canis]SUC10017.1 membrane protein [Pasteurella canis]GJJ80527.1 YcgL domain-containing protein [Pasteurella canis]
MLCAIYKSQRRVGTYLYVAKRDQFDPVPEGLREAFGVPIFVMMFNLAGNKLLVNADKKQVLEQIQQQGFYLQMPKEDDWLFKL